MTNPSLLLKRLDEIGQSLANCNQALALIGLGSVGAELERLDQYSDLDFFAIVAEGSKPAFIQDLSWLSALCPIAYAFQNTADGYKLLFEDGIFCEFAVFELPEIANISFTAGRLVWKAAGIDDSICISRQPGSPTASHSPEWMVGEALTCLYVGLGRSRRGEELSATRFIQHYAVDRILELSAFIETEQPAYADPFSLERRYERRFPGIAQQLPGFVQGYGRNREAAQAILAFLEKHFAVNPAIKQAILGLCEAPYAT